MSTEIMFIANNLTGKRFGKLTVLEPSEKREKRYVVWQCICDCGNECFVDSNRLQRGTITNCGCEPKKHAAAPLVKGEKYGSLTVLERAPNKGSHTAWRCICDCGNEVVVATCDLRSGHTKSCGCYWKAENCQGIGERLHWIDGTCIERLNLQKPRSDNRSGHIGIHKVDENCYRAFIGFKGEHYYLGTYTNLEDAIDARHRGEQIHTDFLELYYREKAEGISSKKI